MMCKVHVNIALSQPKYIGNLIKAAEDRKKEMERRMEKKIHKEREAEKGKYDDSESFVTDAYRKKMELMKQEEEDERRREQMEGNIMIAFEAFWIVYILL